MNIQQMSQALNNAIPNILFTTIFDVSPVHEWGMVNENGEITVVHCDTTRWSRICNTRSDLPEPKTFTTSRPSGMDWTDVLKDLNELLDVYKGNPFAKDSSRASVQNFWWLVEILDEEWFDKDDNTFIPRPLAIWLWQNKASEAYRQGMEEVLRMEISQQLFS